MTPEEVRAKLNAEYSTVLSPQSLQIGALTARRIFSGRGDHSGIHLSEIELAAFVATAVETFIQVNCKKR